MCISLQHSSTALHANIHTVTDGSRIMRGPVLQTLGCQGLQAIPPYSNRGLHPYAIPLAEGDFRAWGDKQTGVVCVLRWPQPGKCPNMEMPVVVMTRGAAGMQLVARSAREYVARALAEEDRATGALDDSSGSVSSHPDILWQRT